MVQEHTINVVKDGYGWKINKFEYGDMHYATAEELEFFEENNN